MVHVNRKGRDQGSRHSLSAKQCVCVGICVIACSFYWYFLSNNEAPTNENALHKLVQQQDHLGSKSPPSISVSSSLNDPCPYMKVTDLNTDERHPKAGPRRHLVTPPEDGPVTLVCCSTTKGPWNILVHHNWAPHGAERFVAMVRAAYFQNQVPLMRCVHNFLCQFGLAGSASSQFGKNIPDDPNWLPEGPAHRKNELGVRRFSKGYLAYAGAGPNTRSNQLIVSLADVGTLAGGSPWEVPWGELVGKHSFETLDRIFTGYGDKGPAQGRLHRPGHSEWVKSEFPDLDWVNSCAVVDEG